MDLDAVTQKLRKLITEKMFAIIVPGIERTMTAHVGVSYATTAPHRPLNVINDISIRNTALRTKKSQGTRSTR